MADVYANDDDKPFSADPSATLLVVIADADPDALARVAAVARLGNVSPTAGSFVTRDDGTIVISLEMHGLPAATVEFLRRKLEQISTVHCAEAHSVTVRGDRSRDPTPPGR